MVRTRPGTSDERVLKEVLGGTYRRLAIDFDVEKGERWIGVPTLPKGGRFVQWPMADRLIFCKGAK
jgi:hypothetical protein